MRSATVRKTAIGRRGQATLEAAFVMLVFLATLIGIFDLGQVLFVHQTFVARVRGAARYGVVRSYDAGAIRNMVLYGQLNSPSGTAAGVFGLTAAMVGVSQFSPGTSEARIVVTISGYPYRLFSPWIGQSFTGSPIIASLPMESP